VCSSKPAIRGQLTGRWVVHNKSSMPLPVHTTCSCSSNSFAMLHENAGGLSLSFPVPLMVKIIGNIQSDEKT
jgi:hypothetical protein